MNKGKILSLSGTKPSSKAQTKNVKTNASVSYKTISKASKSSANKFSNKTKTFQSNKKLITPSERIVVLFNKPFDVLSQFTDDQHRKTLSDFIDVKEVYAAGRLDRDSEGLMLLTNDGKLQQKITSPKYKKSKTYWAQVEGIPTPKAIKQLEQGVILKDGITLPAKISIIDSPNIWARTPPIRERANIPTTWLSITITEGRNRQVRRMTAHIGCPTLRLIRASIGEWKLEDLASGAYKIL